MHSKFLDNPIRLEPTQPEKLPVWESPKLKVLNTEYTEGNPAGLFEDITGIASTSGS